MRRQRPSTPEDEAESEDELDSDSTGQDEENA
jgi:hypothetical protein